MDRFFKLKENGTNVRTEIVAGLTTFMTMAYILLLTRCSSDQPGRGCRIMQCFCNSRRCWAYDHHYGIVR